MRIRPIIFNINCRFFTVNSNKKVDIKQKKNIYKNNENIKLEPLINKNLNTVYFSPYMVHPIRKNEYYKNHKID